MTKWQVYASSLQWQALRNDLAREKVDAQQKPRTPVKPPIVATSELRGITDFDKKFERDCGIDLEENGDRNDGS
jgi:hypothetical protein